MPKNQREESRITRGCARVERRGSTRVPDRQQTEIRFSTPELGDRAGQLEEISLDGFAMTVGDSSAPDPDREILAHFTEGSIRAIVRCVSVHDDGSCRVGAEWVQPKSPIVIGLLRRCLENG